MNWPGYCSETHRKMVVFAFLYGLFFVGIGFFVKKYPDTIAGYSTLSAERKKRVDIEGLSSYLKKMLIVAGIGSFVLFLIFRLICSLKVAVISMMIPVLLLLYAAFFSSWKYGLFRKK